MRMSDYTLTRRAEADLFDIAVHGYRQFGVRQAEAYAAGLEHAFQLSPTILEWAERPTRSAQACTGMSMPPHVILYEVVTDGVLILAIVHGRSVRRLPYRGGALTEGSALAGHLSDGPRNQQGRMRPVRDRPSALWRRLALWPPHSVQRSGRSLNVDLAVPASRHAMSGYASPRASRRKHQENTAAASRPLKSQRPPSRQTGGPFETEIGL